MSMQIFGGQATEEKAENARLSSFVGALALGDLVKSTLGPKGMNKILQSASTGEINVTNDGATILKAIQLDNAAAKILVNISKVQDDEIGDGTTSVCVLAAELLREAEKLIAQKIHPQPSLKGIELRAWQPRNPMVFRRDLFNIARTTLSSKVLSQDKDYFANLAVDAVLRVEGITDLEHIQIIKKSRWKAHGLVLDEGATLSVVSFSIKTIAVNSPKRLENAKILIANTSMDTDKIKIFGARVKVDERAEKPRVEDIAAHGINCFSLLAEKGIMVIEHADFEGVERLSLVTGGEITSTFERQSWSLIKFSGVAAGEACTVVSVALRIRWSMRPNRSLHDALSVLSQTVKETRTVLGGGCSEMLMSCAVDEEVRKIKGKKAIAVEAFGRALRQIPTILADNAGYDSSDFVSRLRAAHYEGQTDAGLDMNEATIASMRKLGITESYKLKRQVVLSASEAAEMIIRVDDILRASPRQREAV
ncbi:chaperonin Cpn60/TCP-1 family [Armillaria luteobubalina]|uniref:CCT-beta n=1 Tax=Armillaria luteobubalina TaxID=153913 RepID=A0AA39PAC7_9AGAR|nr:chaperonin Cpn60/TCP-1 family [Armillaria luteobubalina]